MEDLEGPESELNEVACLSLLGPAEVSCGLEGVMVGFGRAVKLYRGSEAVQEVPRCQQLIENDLGRRERDFSGINSEVKLEGLGGSRRKEGSERDITRLYKTLRRQDPLKKPCYAV